MSRATCFYCVFLPPQAIKNICNSSQNTQIRYLFLNVSHFWLFNTWLFGRSRGCCNVIYPMFFNPLLSRHYFYTNARKSVPPPQVLHCSKRSSSNSSLHWGLVFYPILSNEYFSGFYSRGNAVFEGTLSSSIWLLIHKKWRWIRSRLRPQKPI